MSHWVKISQREKAVIIGALIVVPTAIFGVIQLMNGSHAIAHAASAEPVGPAFVRAGDQIVVPERSPMRSHLLVQAVGASDMPRSLTVPASVEADPSRTANIVPPLTGRVIELKARLGDHVSKGQALLTLASGDLAQANADVGKASDALQLSKRALDRARQVFGAGGGADKDVQQAESNHTQAFEEYQRAEERVKALGGSAGDERKSATLTLTAPISGNVTALSIAPGAYANDPTASIMTIANLDSVWFTANVPEDAVSFVARGQRVGVTLPAYPGEVFHGKVAFVSTVLDPDTRSDKVRVAFDNRQGKFKPNMFANVTFAVPQGRRIFVPNSALLMNNDRVTVFVEVAPWTFVRRSVDIGYSEGDKTLVREGLNVGERVIAKGGVLLND